MQINSYRFPFCLIAISVGLSACGLGEKKDASQVVARVNGNEITVHQVSQVLSHTPGITAENADKARKEVLEHLIVQELAVAKAIDSKLDRTPDVVMALEASRRDILARAYFSQVAGASSPADKAEVRSYYDEHPELFSQRRIYSLTDIALQRDEKLIAPLQEMAANNKSMQEIARWLKENGTNFEANNYTSAAEQLSLEILPKLAKVIDGQTTVIAAGQVVHVINLVKSRLEPVDFATASPQIQKFLGSERGQQLISGEIKRLKDTAKVEYFGEFSAEKAQPISAPAADAKPADPVQAKAADEASIAKSVGGLK